MKYISILAALLVPGLPAAAPPTLEAPTRVVERAAPVPLVARPLPPGALDDALFPGVATVFVVPPDVERLRREDADRRGGPKRIGITLEVDLRSASRGTWTRLADGTWLWTLAVDAPGAHGLRAHVRVDGPAAGSPILVYEPARPDRATVFQATPRGTWGPLVSSDTLRLVFREPGTAHPEVVIDRVAYVYESLAPGDELPCHLDVNCYPDWDTEKWAVGRMYFSDGTDWWFATGALVNRTSSDETPLLLTAEHGVIEIDTLSISFGYQTNTCNGVPDFYGSEVRGVAELASDPDSDLRLLGLTFDLPTPRTFLGWNANPWPNNSVEYCIHHPRGSYKRIASGTMLWPETSPDYPNVYRVRYYQGNGVTETGSSGAPVFDGAHLVRGVASAEPRPPGCSRSNDMWIGRLDTAFPHLAPFLDPVDPVWVDQAYAGTEQGTPSQPFTRVSKGIYAVRKSSVVHIRPGHYGEALEITKPMTLSGAGGVVTIGGAVP